MDILRSAIGLLRVYREETGTKLVTPTIAVLKDCMEYFANKDDTTGHDRA